MRLLAFLLLCCFFPKNVAATHIVGGEITYECLGNQEYRIRMTVYRDCYNGNPWFDNPAYIGIYNSGWQLVDSLRILVSPDDTIPIILSNPCLTVPPNVCVHRTSYEGTVTLPVRPGGYTVVYQRCCRNTLIRNIVSPLNTGASFTAELSEQALLACNTSAVFNNWPPVAICVNEPIDFDHSATDTDGDSLVYRLCTPLDGASFAAPIPQPPNPGPYETVTWLPPYDLSNVLGGQPLTIDAHTGFITGIPNTLGNFVVGICVDEYRDSLLLSTTRRDFQYNVADCGQPLAAFFSPETLCALTVQFQNESSSSDHYQWFFDWPGNLSATSTEAFPTHIYPDTGLYTIALIANPGGLCSDTAYRQIRLSRPFLAADFVVNFPSCDTTGAVLQAVDESTDPQFGIASWDWALYGPSGLEDQSDAPNPAFTLHEAGLYELQLIITSGNGCRDSLSTVLESPVPPLAQLPDTLFICAGDTVALFPLAVNSPFSYSWSPAATLNNPTLPNPLAFPLQSTTYTVLVSGNGPCTAVRRVQVNVNQPGVLEVTAAPDTLLLGASSQLQASFPGASDFLWSPVVGLSDPTLPNPVATPTQTTTYTVRPDVAGGCIPSATLRLVVLFPECKEPFVFFPTAFSPNGDGENDALRLESSVVASAYWAIYNRWGEKIFETNDPAAAWDGTWHGSPQPAETYGYYLEVTCANGGPALRKKGNVTLLR